MFTSRDSRRSSYIDISSSQSSSGLLDVTKKSPLTGYLLFAESSWCIVRFRSCLPCCLVQILTTAQVSSQSFWCPWSFATDCSRRSKSWSHSLVESGAQFGFTRSPVEQGWLPPGLLRHVLYQNIRQHVSEADYGAWQNLIVVNLCKYTGLRSCSILDFQGSVNSLFSLFMSGNEIRWCCVSYLLEIITSLFTWQN